MKILHISYLRTRANGIYSVLSALCKEQKLLGHDIQIINTYKNNQINDSLFIDLHNFSNIKHFIKNNKPNIVIFHSLYVKQYILIYKYLYSNNIPYLIQLHGALSMENYKKGIIKKYIANLLFYNSFMKKAKSIIYLNKSEYNNSIVKYINKANIYISNGCYLPAYIKKNHFNKQILSILYLGRIDIHHKGLDILIEAVKILLNRGLTNRFHLKIYGSGLDNDMKLLSNILTTIPPNIVSYNGAVYGKEKEEVFKESDIFILTSRYEGMPMGVLEALSYGLPCILTPGTNLASIIEENNAGWKVDFKSKNIADTIEYIITNYHKNKYTLIKNAQLLAEHYSWQKIAIHSINEYKKIICQNGK